MAIEVGRSIPERMEKHANKNWFDRGLNHKTTLTMGTLVPMACKLVYPGEFVKVRSEVMMRFAPLILPIMHQCYFTWDWFYVGMNAIWPGAGKTSVTGFSTFIKQDPNNPVATWAYFDYKRADAVFTDGVLNYMGFNAPPTSGTLILSTRVNATPPVAYCSIWHWYYRNANIQGSEYVELQSGDMTALVESMLPNLRVLRRNWPRDYYTVATLTPQLGAQILMPSFANDPETGLAIPQILYKVSDGTTAAGGLSATAGTGVLGISSQPVVLQLSSTINDFSYAQSMANFMERHLRAGGSGNGSGINYTDFVMRNFDWNPNPLLIDKPVWIGGYTGDVVITDVMATAESDGVVLGDYSGKAMVRDTTPEFSYTCPDYGYIIPILTVYPKASYYQGTERMWRMENKMDYMWEQFALIGDQPLRNEEVWFSWYDADIAWNREIFGYVPQYHWERFSIDIVSGQMRTLWESFHLGRKFTSAAGTALNPTFIECRPDIGRVFEVDAEAGEHECYVHAWVGIDILKRLPKFGLPVH